MASLACAPVRVALLNPTYWPEVRRGAERLVHDLAVSLTRAGHDVTVLTTHRGRTSRSVEGGFEVVRSYRLPDRPFHARSYNYHLHTAPGLAWRLIRGDFDVAHAFQPAAAWAAVEARRLGGPPVVCSLLGAITRAWVEGDRMRFRMLERTVRGAACTTVLSESVAKSFAQFVGREAVILPGGVIGSDFEGPANPARSPTLICAASLNDPRKRGPLLLAAFERLRRDVPDARLLLAGKPDPTLVHGQTLSLPEGAGWIEADRTESLAAAYASAWASVLPAVDEAFGLVLLESLAAGTPAVAARSGGCPEILSTDSVGRLFEPDDEGGLTQAMAEALELGRHPHTPEACRARAREFDWDAVLPRYEELYRSAVRTQT